MRRFPHKGSKDVTEQIFTIDQQNIQSTVDIEEKSDQRIKQSIPSKVSYWSLLKIMLILGYSAAFLSSQFLIPRYNPIYYPDYWYGNMFFIVSNSAGHMRRMLELFVFTKQKS